MKLIFSLLIGSCLMMGCTYHADPFTRVEINGHVTLDDKPVEEGTIRFSPAKGTEAPVSGGEIENGSYSITSKGGIPVGTYRVEITAFEPHATENAEPSGPIDLPSRKQLVPARYNEKSTLQRTISVDGPTTLNFDLKSGD